MTLTTYGTKIDLRTLAARERKSLVFYVFRSLGVSESMELIDDEDPRPLHDRMQAEQPGQFSWVDLQGGPDVWRIRITKLVKSLPDGQCCGACGGA